MKLAIITERANITLGGAERSVFELAARMALLGVDVKILAATGSTESHRVKVLCSSTEKRIALKDFRESLLRHFDENHYDIIHSTLPFDFADVYQPRGGSYPEAAIRNAASYETSVSRIFKLLTSFANLKRAALARAEKKLCAKDKGPIIAALSEYVRTNLRNITICRTKEYALSPTEYGLAHLPENSKPINSVRRFLQSSISNKLMSLCFSSLPLITSDSKVLQI